jgi:hypothetical protein
MHSRLTLKQKYKENKFTVGPGGPWNNRTKKDQGCLRRRGFSIEIREGVVLIEE